MPLVFLACFSLRSLRLGETLLPFWEAKDKDSRQDAKSAKEERKEERIGHGTGRCPFSVRIRKLRFGSSLRQFRKNHRSTWKQGWSQNSDGLWNRRPRLRATPVALLLSLVEADATHFHFLWVAGTGHGWFICGQYSVGRRPAPNPRKEEWAADERRSTQIK